MKRPWMESAKAAAVALTVAAPMSYVLQISMGISQSFWYTLLFAALSIALLELINWNKWTAIGIPAVLLLACGYLWLIFTKDQRESIVDYYWWVVDFLYNGGAYPPGNAILLTAATSFLTALVIWLFGRRFFFFPAVFAFVVAFLLFKWLQGLDIVLAPGVAACGGLILMWAKSFQRKAAKKSGKKLPENGIALYLLPVAALIAIISLVSVPAKTAESWQNRQVYDMLERINNFIADYTEFSRPRHSFSISAYGFMPMGTRLGGPTKLSEGEVLYVSAPRRMLLRGIVYNNYEDNRWTDSSQSKPLRMDGANKAAMDDAFDIIRPQLTEPYLSDFKRFIEPITVHAQPAVNSSSTLFVPYRGVTGITSDKFLAVLPKFNRKGEAFSANDLHAGYSYTIKADYLIYDVGGFDEMMGGLLGIGLEDTNEQATWVNQNFTPLPNNIEKAVYDITLSVIKDCKNDYERAVVIRNYLSSSGHYSLSPTTPPEDMDFVSYFINHDRNGYCTYYASAMAVMARIAGIPSRYVEGYLMPDKSSGESFYTVRGKNAHAWAECYFEGIGWIPFDSTPSGEIVDPDIGGQNTGDIPIPTPTRPDKDMYDDDIGDISPGVRLTWEDIAAYLWLLPALACALALFWVIAMMIRSKVRTSPRRLRRKYPDRGRRCAFLYFECVRMLVYYNYPVKKGETLNIYAARIDRWLRLETGTFIQVAELISKLSYSDYACTEADADFMASLRGDLAKYTYRAVGPWFYLLHHVLGFKVKEARRRDR